MNSLVNPHSGPQKVNVSAYQVGQVVHAVTARYEGKKTAPPVRYSLDTLLDDMLAAHKFAKTDADRQILKQVEGLGTSRTRQAIIDGLVKRGFFITRKLGKRHEVRPSEMAVAMCAAFPALVKDVAMTAKWEIAFSMVEQGKVDIARVIDRSYEYVHEVVAIAKSQAGTIRFQMPPGGSGPSKAPPARKN